MDKVDLYHPKTSLRRIIRVAVHYMFDDGCT